MYCVENFDVIRKAQIRHGRVLLDVVQHFVKLWIITYIVHFATHYRQLGKPGSGVSADPQKLGSSGHKLQMALVSDRCRNGNRPPV